MIENLAWFFNRSMFVKYHTLSKPAVPPNFFFITYHNLLLFLTTYVSLYNNSWPLDNFFVSFSGDPSSVFQIKKYLMDGVM